MDFLGGTFELLMALVATASWFFIAYLGIDFFTKAGEKEDASKFVKDYAGPIWFIFTFLAFSWIVKQM